MLVTGISLRIDALRGAGVAAVLPSPPLAVGAKIVTIGDSIIGYANNATASVIENQGDSEIGWALSVSPRGKNQIWYDAAATAANLVPTYAEASAVDPLFRGGNLGLAGDTSTGVGRRITQALSTGADLFIYAAGVNIGAGDNPVNVVTGNIQTQVSALVSAGKKVILGTLRPRRVSLTPTGYEISTAERDRILSINTWIRANYASLGAVLWDPWEALRDRAYNPGDSLYGSDNPAMTRDKVHLSALGGYTSGCSSAYGAKPLQAALAEIVQPGTWFNADPTVSNILTNGRFTGTGGTANNGCSGSMPNNTFVSNVSGAGQPVTGVASLISNPDTGGQSIQLDITSTGAGAANTFNTIRMSHTNPTTGFASTDYVSAVYEVEIGDATIMPCYQASLGQSSTVSARGLGQTTGSYNNEPYPSNVGRIWIQTEPLLVGARTSLNPRFDMQIRTDVAGSATVKVHRALLRVVPSPVTEFPWVP